MKFISLMLVVLVCLVFFTGCFPAIAPDEPVEPEVPVLTMEANADAVLIIGEPNQVAWSIENIGDLFIREYLLTFNVLYPMKTRDNIIFTVVGNYLEVGEKEEGMLDLVPYDTPETVSVSWELFN